eukprot:GHVR01153201.1.p2 GENE.GHVR01153201.1~~GHVR01153201.1.p2  ORF type:complete len:135 (-),score=9.11 GHVR01153201.1:1972-2376(-)
MKRKVLELSIIVTGKYLKELFKMIIKKEKDMNCIRMGLVILDLSKGGKNKEKEGFSGTMARSMMANGSKEKNMVAEFGKDQMTSRMSVSGRMELSKALECIQHQFKDMRDNFITLLVMEKGLSDSAMETFTLEC